MNKQTNLQVLSYAQMGERQIPIYGSVEEPLFKASDVAEVLEHSNARMMVQNVDEDEKVVSNTYTLGGYQESIFLTEAGLYEVFFQSRKPAAKEFKRVVKSILHTLRTKGEVTVKAVPVKRKPALSKTRVEAFDAYVSMMASRFSLDAVSQQRMCNEFATENDLPLLDYVKAEEGRESISKLLDMYGIAMSAIEANKRLVSAGYLVSQEYHKKGGKVGHYYSVTEKGKEFGDNYQDEHSPKKTQPLWFVKKFANLVQIFN